MPAAARVWRQAYRSRQRSAWASLDSRLRPAKPPGIGEIQLLPMAASTEIVRRVWWLCGASVAVLKLLGRKPGKKRVTDVRVSGLNTERASRSPAPLVR